MAINTTVVLPPDDPLPPPPDRSLIAPDKIAADLMAAILANSTLAAAYTVSQYGSTLHIQKNSGDFTPYVQDTLDNTGLTIVKGSVTGADQLPSQAPEGYRIPVTGDPTTAVDDFWMQFSNGAWNEAPSPGVQTALDGSLMPWRLTSTGTGAGRSFTFGPAEWTPRGAGDDTSNPLPPLDTIDLLFATEGRLGFTAGPNVVMSASNQPTQIFRSSVAQLLPSDPVSVRSTLGNEGRYYAALNWHDHVHLWSTEAQRAFFGDPAITPTTVGMSDTSSYASDPDCLPIVDGTKIYFARNVDGCVRLFEYTLPPGYYTLPEVTDLCTTVPTYLAGSASMIVCDSSLRFLGVVLKGSRNTLYACTLRQGQNGQSVPVWHQWTFSGPVVAATFVDDQLLLLIERGGLVYLESLDVANPADTTLGPVVDAGGSPVIPEVVFDAIYLQDQLGPDATSRVTLRNVTLFQKDTHSGTLQFSDEATPRVAVSAPIPSGYLRIPTMRRIDSTGLTISWTGFITSIELQGTKVSRSARQ